MLLQSPEVLQVFDIAKGFFETDEAKNLTSALTYRLPSPAIINFDKPYWKDTPFCLLIVFIVLSVIGVGVVRQSSGRRKVLENVVNVTEKANQLPTHN